MGAFALRRASLHPDLGIIKVADPATRTVRRVSAISFCFSQIVAVSDCVERVRRLFHFRNLEGRIRGDFVTMTRTGTVLPVPATVLVATETPTHDGIISWQSLVLHYSRKVPRMRSQAKTMMPKFLRMLW